MRGFLVEPAGRGMRPVAPSAATRHDASMATQENWKTSRVLVTGGNGFLGRVVCEKLRDRGCTQLVAPRRAECDFTTPEGCSRAMSMAGGEDGCPDVVIHLAAEVGGIGANREHPGRFFFANMSMAMNLIEAARACGMAERGGRFLLTGTICSYPKHTPVPFQEDELWNGYPEETNGPYGVAKKAAGVMLDAYHREYGLRGGYVLPVNLYGPADNFDEASSHVIPALVRRCIEARDAKLEAIVCWGTGSASREFLYVDDAAEGIVRAAETLEVPEPVNLGTGSEITIKDLVHLIAEEVGYEGRIEWDPTKPDGQPRRCLEVSRARDLLGWEAEVSFREGLRRTIAWYESNRA